MITDPQAAPRRTDLPWLRRRTLRLPTADQPAGEALHDFLTGHSTGEHHHAPTPTPTPAPTPTPTPAPTPTPPSAQHSTPAPTPPTRSATPSLDLDEPVRPATPAPPPPAGPRRRTRTDLRVRGSDRLILTPAEPTVTLTRLQSAIGSLTIEAATSDEVGDLRLGAAYELSSDLEMIMQMTQGPRLAPPRAKRPVLIGSRDRFERVGVDLRQVRDVRRLVVYAFSENRQPLSWAGTLVVSTYGDARIEVPLDSLQGGDIAVLLSIYQVRGELVLRAEMQALYGDVRDACRAYGYEKITWLDGRTPVE